MLRDTIIDMIRWGHGSAMVRDVVHRIQDERRREGDAWARRADPVGLGLFSEGRRILIRSVGPSRFKPHVVEMEVLDELRNLARGGSIRILYYGKAFDPARRPIPWDARVMIPLRAGATEATEVAEATKAATEPTDSGPEA